MVNETPVDQWQDDITYKLMGGDESAISHIRDRWAVRLERAICKRYSVLSNADAEDVVSIAIWKLWRWREQYDGSQGLIQTVLYKIAFRVAEEWRSGRRKWQQAKLHEQGVDPEKLEISLASTREDSPVVDERNEQPPLYKALAEVFAKLPALHRDIWEAYRDANGYEVNAITLGVELGQKHNKGVPYPAATIRGYKSRAKNTIVLEMKKKGFDLKSLGYTND
jgi:RNA polymerase sigma factor (sigma-70 family)